LGFGKKKKIEGGGRVKRGSGGVHTHPEKSLITLDQEESKVYSTVGESGEETFQEKKGVWGNKGQGAGQSYDPSLSSGAEIPLQD